jgi:hypothetical protein
MEKKPFEGERPDRFCFDGHLTMSFGKTCGEEPNQERRTSDE